MAGARCDRGIGGRVGVGDVGDMSRMVSSEDRPIQAQGPDEDFLPACGTVTAFANDAIVQVDRRPWRLS